MKTIVCILIGVLCAFASYTVEKNSITVGYCGGNADEITALHATITGLGFNAYQSGVGTAADFTAHNCQLVFNYIGSNAVTDWQAQMSGPGRGYIQCSNSGWSFFSCSRQDIPEGANVTVSNITQGQELTTYPNVIPTGWSNAHGLASYSHPNQDYLASCTEGTLFTMGVTTSGSVNCPKALTTKMSGPGHGVFYAWCNYGTLATTNDKNLTENAIIYAAQPPKADAGGPYNGFVHQAVTLDASASTDNVSINLYEWDINNDGVYELSVTTPITTYTWESPYSGLIKLRCTDNILGKSTSTATVNILVNTDVRDSSLGEIKAFYQ
jgi:hypothetical protein